MPDTRRALSALQTLYADNTAGDISAQDLRDGVQSMHGEQLIQSDTHANEPASGQLTGDLFLPSNGYTLRRYSGSAWVPWGPIFPFTRVVSGDFAWINQGTATITTTNGGVHLSDTDVGLNLRIRKKSAPATPYVITAAFLLAPALVNGQKVGLCFRQSSDGKVHAFGFGRGAGVLTLASEKWAGPGSYTAAYSDVTTIGDFGLAFLRIADDGSNRICSYSPDFQNWYTFHSVGRTDYLTADEVGFFLDPRTASYATAGTLLSWKET
jgi:hypothetical protein